MLSKFENDKKKAEDEKEELQKKLSNRDADTTLWASGGVDASASSASGDKRFAKSYTKCWFEKPNPNLKPCIHHRTVTLDTSAREELAMKVKTLNRKFDSLQKDNNVLKKDLKEWQAWYGGKEEEDEEEDDRSNIEDDEETESNNEI